VRSGCTGTLLAGAEWGPEVVRKPPVTPRFLATLAAAFAAVVSGAPAAGPSRDLASFERADAPCYDRRREPYTAVVDSHLHARPYAGAAVPFEELVGFLDRAGVRFANIYGIGQVLPAGHPCLDYSRCPGVPVLPSVRNDLANAADVLRLRPRNVHLALSMSFPDLANPGGIVRTIRDYDRQFPGLFRWMGEANLAKQALFGHGHRAASPADIRGWKAFMDILRERRIPLTLHCDLGDATEPGKYLPLMRTVLRLYPDNSIVWAHLGLSREQTAIDPAGHIAILKSFLDQAPNLMLDASWRILEQNVFGKPGARGLYAAFFNRYSDRILPGTDFVAGKGRAFRDYATELDITSRIYAHLDDAAFRNIALGENYFRLLGLPYRAPAVCPGQAAPVR
jgi:hypothetical protein